MCFLSLKLLWFLESPLRMIVEENVGNVCVLGGSFVVGLEGRGEGGLPLLAPHQARGQEVNKHLQQDD